MKMNRIWPLAALGILLCTAAGVVWQWDTINDHLIPVAVGKDNGTPGGNSPAGAAIKTVGVVRPDTLSQTNVVTFPGRARAGTQATLFFRVSAPLEHIHANPGDHVRRGDLLLELDDRDYRRQVQVVESKLKSARASLLKMESGARDEDVKILKANLAAAQADLDLARKELSRHRILYRTKSVTEQAYDTAKTRVRGLESRVDALTEQLARDTSGARKEDIMQAQAGIEELNVQLAIARDRLSDTRLLAPFDGVVTRRIPDAHEMVAQGAPVMMLDDISRLEIPVDVPETLVRQVLGLKGCSCFTARFLTAENQDFAARLTEYSSRADAATGTYEFVFTVSLDASAMIFPGMTAEICVTGPGQPGNQGVAVPLKSLLGVAGNTAHVFRLNPDTHQVERQAVVFEALSGSDAVNVVSGLSRSDLVVAEGAGFIRQGETVKFELPAGQGAE